jgi:hypothetical protein
MFLSPNYFFLLSYFRAYKCQKIWTLNKQYVFIHKTIITLLSNKISNIFSQQCVKIAKNSHHGMTPEKGQGIVFLKRGCPGWGANTGPVDFIYFLIFTTLPLSHSGSPGQGIVTRRHVDVLRVRPGSDGAFRREHAAEVAGVAEQQVVVAGHVS